MAKPSAAPSSTRRRANAVTLLPIVPHRFLRLLAAIPKKIARRRRQRGLVAVSPSSPPPLLTFEKQRCAIRTQTPSPTREAETPQQPKRPEAEERSADAAAAAGKYWAHRHSLFSLYDRGVLMDAEGWYSATPEAIAAAQAARAAPAGLVVDAFAGVGGNSIQFAARGCYVVAVETVAEPAQSLSLGKITKAISSRSPGSRPGMPGCSSATGWRSIPARWSWRGTTRGFTVWRT